jgi:hypothetical protein
LCAIAKIITSNFYFGSGYFLFLDPAGTGSYFFLDPVPEPEPDPGTSLIYRILYIQKFKAGLSKLLKYLKVSNLSRNILKMFHTLERFEKFIKCVSFKISMEIFKKCVT